MAPSNLLEAFERAYFDGFLDAGGSSVKVVVGSESERSQVSRDIDRIARTSWLVRASTDYGALTPLNQLFFQLAKDADWRILAQRYWIGLLKESELIYDENDLSITHTAAINSFAEAICRKELLKILSNGLFKRKGILADFRHAMFALIRERLEPSQVRQDDADLAISWLRNEYVAISPLKRLQLTRRISRSMSRPMISSMVRFARSAGFSSVVMLVDFSGYSLGERNGRRFSTTSTLEFYESMRQFIDAIDELEGLFLVFLTDGAFLHSDRRSYRAYDALRLRLATEVASNQANLLAPLQVLQIDG